MKKKIFELLLAGIASILFGFIGFIISDYYKSNKGADLVYYTSSSTFTEKDTTLSKIIIVEIANRGNLNAENIRCLFKISKSVKILNPTTNVVKCEYLTAESNETDKIYQIDLLSPGQTYKFSAIVNDENKDFDFSDKADDNFVKVSITSNYGNAEKIATTDNSLKNNNFGSNSVVYILVILTFVIIISSLIIANELKKIKYSTSYKIAVDILQQQKIRDARNVIMNMYDEVAAKIKTEDQIKNIANWTEEQIKSGDAVCATYDTVGILISQGLLPIEMIADSWGKSLRKTYSVLKYLIEFRRAEFGGGNHEYWDDYEKLAKAAEKFKKDKKD